MASPTSAAAARSGCSQKLGDERRQLRAVAAQRLALTGDDALQVRYRAPKVIVHHHKVEFAVMGHVRRRLGEAPRDDFGGVGGAARKALGPDIGLM